AGQGVLRAVGDGERFVEVLRLEHGEDRAEDLFLGDDGRRSDVREDVRPDVGSFTDEKTGIARMDEPCFLFALVDVSKDALASFVIDDGADLAAWILGGADLE